MPVADPRSARQTAAATKASAAPARLAAPATPLSQLCARRGAAKHPLNRRIQRLITRIRRQTNERSYLRTRHANHS